MRIRRRDEGDSYYLGRPSDEIEGNPARPRVLVFSQRNIFKNVLFRCPHHEFEDIVCQIDSAEILAPQVEKPLNLRYKLAKQVAWHSSVGLNPGVPKVRLNKQYDLFFAVCGSPVDILSINSVENWKESAKTSICLVDELWIRQIPDYKHYLKMLAKFDVVMLYYSQSVKPVSQVTERPCVFLPPGIDTLKFCPYPQVPERAIDVYSIGRRSDVAHQALLKWAGEKGRFYLHDSISGDHAINSKEHRALFAETAKRSRYFIVNPGLIDRPAIRGNQSEIGNRYFEGAASGAIMIGEHPENEQFGKLFDWPGAVVHSPYNSGEISRIIEGMDGRHDEHDKMRRSNVANALMRHDWVYRWESVLDAAGLDPMPALLRRKERLRSLAVDVSAPVLSGVQLSLVERS